MTVDQILSAWHASHPADRATILKYIAWVRLRRRVHQHFYSPVHWVQNPRRLAQYHWLG